VRILLDECLPKRLKRELANYEVRTVPEVRWAGTKNGELLRLAETQFDVFLTVDQNIEFQQSVPAFELAIVVLVAHSNDIDDLRPLMPQVREMLSKVKAGEIIHVRA